MFTAVVTDRREVADDVVAFDLAAPGGDALPQWEPGAHIDIGVEAPGSPDVRQYSLCGSPEDRATWRIAVLRETAGRGGSDHLHREIHAGSSVQVSLPRNNFPLAEAPSYVFVGGGIGITPLLPMIDAVHRAGTPWQLFYGGRSRASMAFVEELTAYGQQVEILPQDEVGLLPIARIGTLCADNGAALYCCGPEPLLAAMEAQDGPPAVHVERFSAKPVVRSVPDASFEVRLASSGRTVTVGAGEALVDALERSGVSVMTSCREGTCSSCETKVLGGAPIHRDSVLTDDERESGDTMMVCVSRAPGGTLLELDL